MRGPHKSPRSKTQRCSTWFYSRAKEPIYFDPSKTGRFNSPDRSFGVLYAAKRINGAFAETFLREVGRTPLPSDLVMKKGLVRLRSRRALRLANLYGPGLARLGATSEVSSVLPYESSQAWAAALHNHPCKCDGIAYRSRLDDDEICYALFERSASAIAEIDRDGDLLNADWFLEPIRKYKMALLL
jgi:hypothetical protein